MANQKHDHDDESSNVLLKWLINLDGVLKSFAAIALAGTIIGAGCELIAIHHISHDIQMCAYAFLLILCLWAINTCLIKFIQKSSRNR